MVASMRWDFSVVELIYQARDMNTEEVLGQLMIDVELACDSIPQQR
jgi:hypothetical protein